MREIVPKNLLINSELFLDRHLVSGNTGSMSGICEIISATVTAVGFSDHIVLKTYEKQASSMAHSVRHLLHHDVVYQMSMFAAISSDLRTISMVRGRRAR